MQKYFQPALTGAFGLLVLGLTQGGALGQVVVSSDRNFDVKVGVIPSCALSISNHLLEYAPRSGAVLKTYSGADNRRFTDVSITCTNGTPYSTSFVSTSASTRERRLMTLNGAKSTIGVTYYLRTGDPYALTNGQPILNGGASQLSGIGTGSVVTTRVNALLDPDYWKALFDRAKPLLIAGDYFDLVTVTLTF